MRPNRFIAALATTALLAGAAMPSLAEGGGDIPFPLFVAMDRMDKNKDGMVSKKEFMEMMAKVWDMKAKAMQIKNDKMNAEDFKQILMYLQAGG